MQPSGKSPLGTFFFFNSSTELQFTNLFFKWAECVLILASYSAFFLSAKREGHVKVGI